MSDFNVKVTVRSHRILEAINERFGSQSEMARQTGMSVASINSFVCLRCLPVGANGWTDKAENFASALGVYPSDLWPDHLRDVRLRTATAEVSMDMAEVERLCAPQSESIRGILDRGQAGLDERQITAIEAFKSGWTFDELGAELGVTRERARQIQAKAMRKMKQRFLRLGVRELEDVL